MPHLYFFVDCNRKHGNFLLKPSVFLINQELCWVVRQCFFI